MRKNANIVTARQPCISRPRKSCDVKRERYDESTYAVIARCKVKQEIDEPDRVDDALVSGNGLVMAHGCERQYSKKKRLSYSQAFFLLLYRKQYRDDHRPLRGLLQEEAADFVGDVLLDIVRR